MNGHEEPVPMIIKEGASKFYACPKYMLMDDNHPDGHLRGEAACTNQMSFNDAEDIVMQFSKIVEEDLMEDVYTDYSDLTFRVKNIDVTVLLYDTHSAEDGEASICLGILNRATVRH